MSSSWYHDYEQDEIDKKRMDEEHRKKERFIDKATTAYENDAGIPTALAVG